MLGRRMAAVIGLTALLLTGATFVGSVDVALATQPLDPGNKNPSHGVPPGWSQGNSSGPQGVARGHLVETTEGGLGMFGGTSAPVTTESFGEPSVGGAPATTNGA